LRLDTITLELTLVAAALSYLDFHHVDTQPLPLFLKNHVANAKIGLHEVTGMHCLVSALDMVALKHWFREEVGMSNGVLSMPLKDPQLLY
jgi:hypothetical protein